MHAAREALLKIVKKTSWRSLRGDAFLGATTIETANTLYYFTNGVFSGRARMVPNDLPAWESPHEMRGVELIGFLTDEGGLWSLSTRWRPGALAVISTNEKAFTLTSPTVACTIEEPQQTPKKSSMLSSPPTVRRPAPPSMTRLQSAPPR